VKKTFRTISIVFMTAVAFIEIPFFVGMLIFPNCSLYQWAVEFNWLISPFWVGTALASMVFMAEIMWFVAIKKGALTTWPYKFLRTTAWVWILVLAFYETVVGRFHISKIVDAVMWFLIFLAARYVYRYDRVRQ